MSTVMTASTTDRAVVGQRDQDAVDGHEGHVGHDDQAHRAGQGGQPLQQERGAHAGRPPAPTRLKTVPRRKPPSLRRR